MKPYTVTYCAKELIYPRFGWSFPYRQAAYVRNDLPGPVKKFVRTHEVYHLGDAATWWIWREIKANCYAGVRHPIGFIMAAAMSLAPARIKYYWNRFREGK